MKSTFEELGGTYHREATRMFARLVEQMKKAEGVQELTKDTDQMEWVLQMNSIGNRTMETVNRELIYQ